MEDDVKSPLLDDAPVGSLPKAIIAGAVAALIGAGVWAGIEIATDTRIGLIAIGIGFLCGFAVRVAGKGTSVAFRVVGAACSLAGCFAGCLIAFNYLLGKIAAEKGIDAHFAFADLVSFTAQNLGGITWLIFAFAVWQGWKLSVADE